MNEQLKKRIWSLIWRVGGMALVTVIAFFVQPDVVAQLHIPQWSIIGGGLIVSEITKWLNS